MNQRPPSAEPCPPDRPVLPRTILEPSAGFCRGCAMAGVCGAVGHAEAGLSELHELVEHDGPYQPGDYLVRRGDPFRAISAVRSGAVKTCRLNDDGREQVLGFYLPGEVIGLNAIHPARFPCDVVALETTWLCRLPFASVNELATRMPAVQKHLFDLLSRELGAVNLLAGNHAARERLAAFLLDLRRRQAGPGMLSDRFTLGMPRTDIANYLQLAPETVSRVIHSFRSQGLIDIDGRDVHLRDIPRLTSLGRHLLAD